MTYETRCEHGISWRLGCEMCNRSEPTGQHPPNLRLSRAAAILRDAGDAICERQITRDNGSEKSMRRTLRVFQSLTGQDLMTESQGWLFMACVKLGRSQQGKFHQDDYTDAVAYIALAGEAAAKEAEDGPGPERH